MCMLLNQLENHDRSEKSSIQRKRDVGLKKATEIINHQLDECLSIGELCHSVGLSERTLEYAFKEKYQVSPKEYIKTIKLNKIKSELIQSEGQKISTIAAKYGFWHMGQFAADFRKQFGLLPSVAIKKTPPIN